jgi:hypothetical protein
MDLSICSDRMEIERRILFHFPPYPYPISHFGENSFLIPIHAYINNSCKNPSILK